MKIKKTIMDSDLDKLKLDHCCYSSWIIKYFDDTPQKMEQHILKLFYMNIIISAILVIFPIISRHVFTAQM